MTINTLILRGVAGAMHRYTIPFLACFAALGLMLAQIGQNQPRQNTLALRLGADNHFVNPYEPTIVRLGDPGVELSTDPGRSFAPIPAPFEITGGVRFYFEANENGHIYAQSLVGQLSFSDDFGDSWRSIPLPAGFGDGKLAPFAVRNDGRTQLFLGSAEGPSGVTAIGVAFNQDAVAVGTESGFVHVSEDVTELNPRSWISSQLRASPVALVEFDPANVERLVAGFGVATSNTSDSVLYYTEVGGRFWRSGDGMGGNTLPNEPVLSAYFAGRKDDSFLLYLRIGKGFYATQDF